LDDQGSVQKALIEKKEKLGKEVQDIHDANNEMNILIETLEKDLKNLEKRKSNESAGWKDYIEDIVGLCKRIGHEIESICGNKEDDGSFSELKSSCDDEFCKIESFIRSRMIMERVLQDKKKDVVSLQGREKTNIIRINQLVKDIETLNSNVKDIKEKIGDQEKTIEDRKKSIDESNTNLNDLRIKEVELHGESIGIESTIDALTKFIDEVKKLLNKISMVEKIIEESCGRLTTQLQDTGDYTNTLENVMSS